MNAPHPSTPDSASDLGPVFAAVSDPTRRRILARLTEGTATVSELAKPFDMSLPAVSKHLKVLERAGLLERRIEGRVHHCRAVLEPLLRAEAWIAQRSAFWDEALDSLSDFLREPREAKQRCATGPRGLATVRRDESGTWRVERLLWTEDPDDTHPARR